MGNERVSIAILAGALALGGAWCMIEAQKGEGALLLFAAGGFMVLSSLGLGSRLLR